MMDISLDKFYKYIFNVLQSTIPEEILGKITVAVSIVLYIISCVSSYTRRENKNKFFILSCFKLKKIKTEVEFITSQAFNQCGL